MHTLNSIQNVQMFDFWPGRVCLMNEEDNDQAASQLIKD